MDPKLIILDRDGVINQERKHGIHNKEQFIPIPQSLEAIAHLTKLGYQIAVATNQSGIGRGLYTEEDLTDIHNKLRTLLSPLGGSIARINHCPHLPTADCACRKPKTGMLEDILSHFKITAPQSLFMVGDSYRDLIAAKTCGLQPVLVTTGHGQATLATNPDVTDFALVYADLWSFVMDKC